MRAAALLGVGLALNLVLVACDRSGAPGDDDEPAGEVLEAKGEVTAIRAGEGPEERALSAGDPIFADDTVATGADSSVRIRLEHNGAIWELHGEARREVRESVAWNAPEATDREDPLARRESGESVAAGRHAEDQAAGTRDTAMRGEETEAAATEEEAPVTAEPAAPARPAVDEEAEPRSRDETRKKARTGRRRSKSKARASRSSKRGSGEIDGLLDSALRGGDGAKRASKEASQRRAVTRTRSAIQACFLRHAEAPQGRITVTLELDKKGHFQGLKLDPARKELAAVGRCARGKLRGAAFGEKAAREIELEIQLER